MAWKRTHTCGELTEKEADTHVTLNGWVSTRRDLGGVIFIDLRDRYGITQVVFPFENKEIHEKAEKLRNEYVIGVHGRVRNRDAENVNDNIYTGKIEVVADQLTIYSKAETPPFEIRDDIATYEDLRLRYRYLDMRRPKIQNNLITRSKAYQAIRNYFYENEYLEVETPVLMRSTPEGARDYLVPSRVNPGKFFALPQSPQTYKQLLMVSGYDRYFQIVKCFRDEDLRADRQPEFTQVDVELSFVDEEEIYEMTEGLMHRLFKDVLGEEIETPFPRMTYEDAIHTYGTDKPDLRFGMEIKDVSEEVKDTEFRVFSSTVQKGGAVVAIVVPGRADLGRGALDRLENEAKQKIDIGGLIWGKYTEQEGLATNIDKFLEAPIKEEIAKKCNPEEGDLVLILAGDDPQVFHQMGQLRLMMGERENLITQGEHRFTWVTEFPLVEYDEEEGRYAALHHPFTSPREKDRDHMLDQPDKTKARAYDLVLNGKEIGGGSIRIHEADLQRDMFKLLGMDLELAEEKFGFLMDAFKYGAPPHGGIALGLDRIIMLLTGAGSLRDVIAFPKNQRAQSLMDDAPGEVDPKQLEELHVQLTSSARKALEEAKQQSGKE